MPARCAVMLLAHGAPDRMEDIPEFLLKVRGGQPLREEVVREIMHRYSLIGGGTPLRRITEEQARLLRERIELPVFVGMRNWKPYIAEAAAALPSDLERLVAICLAPQNSRTSVGLYRQHLDHALAARASGNEGQTSAGALAGCRPAPCAGVGRIDVRFVENWHDHRLLVQAFATKIRAGLSALPEEPPVILTAHSVPEKTIDAGDPYDLQVRETAALVASAAALRDWRVAYQSQGMTREPWIGPTVESRIDELAAAGFRSVFLAPIGFLCDHAEVLYDIDIYFREYAAKQGMTLHRSESLNDSPLLADALADLVRRHTDEGRPTGRPSD